ncbi:hypothetical protein JNK13_00115 [bacterium]|nr:hypothetical protein [bacterium]
MDVSDNIYWVYSSASQSIATFIGFLIAGYTLVHSLMESAARADETLFEILESLKQDYHVKLSLLILVTASGIIGSLLVMYLYPTCYALWWFQSIQLFTVELILASIVGGGFFVSTIIDPKKYTKAAQRLAKEIDSSVLGDFRSSRSEFVEIFIKIEQRVRILWGNHTDGERLKEHGQVSFREMVDTLHLLEVISDDLYEQLILISRHRNLVVHGHIPDVSEQIFQQAKDVETELRTKLT